MNKLFKIALGGLTVGLLVRHEIIIARRGKVQDIYVKLHDNLDKLVDHLYEIDDINAQQEEVLQRTKRNN